MEFFNSAVGVLQTLVIALGAGLGIWGAINLIDFAAALHGLGKKEAAVQLAQDFGLSYEDWKPPGKAKKPKPRQKSPEEQFQEAKSRCFRVLADYLHLLRAWRTDYAPHAPEEAFHPRFVEALQKQAQVEYTLFHFLNRLCRRVMGGHNIRDFAFKFAVILNLIFG